jgi:hypothetical protein
MTSPKYPIEVMPHRLMAGTERRIPSDELGSRHGRREEGRLDQRRGRTLRPSLGALTRRTPLGRVRRGGPGEWRVGRPGGGVATGPHRRVGRVARSRVLPRLRKGAGGRAQRRLLWVMIPLAVALVAPPARLGAPLSRRPRTTGVSATPAGTLGLAPPGGLASAPGPTAGISGHGARWRVVRMEALQERPGGRAQHTGLVPDHVEVRMRASRGVSGGRVRRSRGRVIQPPDRPRPVGR